MLPVPLIASAEFIQLLKVFTGFTLTFGIEFLQLEDKSVQVRLIEAYHQAVAEGDQVVFAVQVSAHGLAFGFHNGVFALLGEDDMKLPSANMDRMVSVEHDSVKIMFLRIGQYRKVDYLSALSFARFVPIKPLIFGVGFVTEQI